MLFKFGFFWKSLIFIFSVWAMYLIFDFEFTILTLLSLVVITNLNDNEFLS